MTPYGNGYWIPLDVGLQTYPLHRLEEPEIAPIEIGEQQPPLLPMENHEPNWFFSLLEKLLMGAAYVLTLIVVIILSTLVIRAIWRWVRRLLGHMNEANLQSDDTGYEEIKESLLGQARMRRKRKFGIRWSSLRQRQPKWEDLRNNRERARYLYQQLLFQSISRGYEWKPHYTPSETLSDIRRWQQTERQMQASKYDNLPSLQSMQSEKLTSIYWKARYGQFEQEPTDEDIRAMQEMILIQDVP